MADDEAAARAVDVVDQLARCQLDDGDRDVDAIKIGKNSNTTTAIAAHHVAATAVKPVEDAVAAAKENRDDAQAEGEDENDDDEGPQKRYTGRVKWFNVLKGFGFVVRDDNQEELFVHQTELCMEGFRSLDHEEHVSFARRRGRNGYEAYHVTAAESDIKLRGSSVRPLGKKKNKAVRCFRCGQVGYHIARDCHAKLPTDLVCYLCHSPDHISANCPLPGQAHQHVKLSDPRAIRAVQSHIVEEDARRLAAAVSGARFAAAAAAAVSVPQPPNADFLARQMVAAAAAGFPPQLMGPPPPPTQQQFAAFGGQNRAALPQQNQPQSRGGARRY